MNGKSTNDDYKELINEKFVGVYNQLLNYNTLQTSKLNAILYQTTKTNGKVAEIEKRLHDVETFQNKCNIANVNEDIKQLMNETLPTRALNTNSNLYRWASVGKVFFSISIISGVLFAIYKFLLTL